MKDILGRMARGKGSPAQMLRHSQELRDIFAGICNNMGPNNQTQVTNLRAAKHRFESYQRPLGRTIRLLPCIHSLMLQVAVERADTSGATAREWLEWLAATPRHILLAAMMADAADECMLLLRFCDNEAMDVTALCDQISSFLARVNGLFGAGAECLVRVGYTRLLLEQLKAPLVWVMRNKSFVLSAPSANDIAFCLDHMRSWMKLALAELRAEFPDFVMAQAFKVFGMVA